MVVLKRLLLWVLLCSLVGDLFLLAAGNEQCSGKADKNKSLTVSRAQKCAKDSFVLDQEKQIRFKAVIPEPNSCMNDDVKNVNIERRNFNISFSGGCNVTFLWSKKQSSKYLEWYLGNGVGQIGNVDRHVEFKLSKTLYVKKGQNWEATKVNGCSNLKLSDPVEISMKNSGDPKCAFKLEFDNKVYQPTTEAPSIAPTKPPAESSNALWIGLVVAGVLGVIGVIVGLCYCFKQKKKSRNDSQLPTSQVPTSQAVPAQNPPEVVRSAVASEPKTCVETGDKPFTLDPEMTYVTIEDEGCPSGVPAAYPQPRIMTAKEMQEKAKRWCQRMKDKGELKTKTKLGTEEAKNIPEPISTDQSRRTMESSKKKTLQTQATQKSTD